MKTLYSGMWIDGPWFSSRRAAHRWLYKNAPNAQLFMEGSGWRIRIPV